MTLLTGVFSAVAQVGFMLVLAILFSIEKNDVVNFLARLMGSKSTYTYIKLQRLYAKLGFWLKGQFIVMCSIGIIVFILLNVVRLFGIDIPNTGSLALIAGITNIFPYIGPILGSIPALLVTAVALGFP